MRGIDRMLQYPGSKENQYSSIHQVAYLLRVHKVFLTDIKDKFKQKKQM